VLGSVCVLMRLSQLAVYHADSLTPLDVPHDDLLDDDYVDAPALDDDDVTSRGPPMNTRRSSRVNKYDDS